MAGVHMAQLTQTVGTTVEALILGDVPTGAYYDVEIYNRDATNFLEIGNAAGGGFTASIFARVPPLWTCRFYTTGALYVEADTADVDITVRAVAA
jgi:hypothetical protein